VAFRPTLAQKRNRRYRLLLLDTGEDTSGGNPVADFNNVVLQLPFEDADGATSTTDESNTAHSISFLGSSEIDDAEQKIGATSLLIASGGRIQAADDPALEFGLEHLTMEMFVKFNGDPGPGGNMTFVAKWQSSQTSFLWYHTNNEMNFLISTDGASAALTYQEAWDPATDVWYHVAVCLERGATDMLYMFVDGVMLGTGTAAADGMELADRVAAVEIGAHWNGAAGWFVGWMDGVRLVKGEALYTENFTPPTTAYPTS
jgi:hypothetical protein